MDCPACQAPNDDAAEACFTCGKSLFVAPVAITRGSVIAERYEVLSPLGRGGMGMVYKAHDRILDEPVAVKTLRADVAREAEGARRFRSEIKLARNIRHRNVCAIHEYGEAGGLRYIAMELVDGVDLRRHIRERGALPEREAFEVAIQAANGLQAIHKAGIIHRDLKTSNIMRDPTGRVRVMDFGIAKRFGTESTLGGRVVGTPEYMSPEQARGHKLDFRSDVYALGIVIYEVFMGRVPFQAETPIATILMHINEPPLLEGPRAERLPAPLVPVLRRALAKTPDARFSTARELAEALESARAASGDPAGSSARERAADGQPAPGDTGAPDDALRGVRPSAPAGELPWGSAASRRVRANRWLLVAAGVALAAALALIATRDDGQESPAVVASALPTELPLTASPQLTAQVPDPLPPPVLIETPRAGTSASPPTPPKRSPPVAESTRPTAVPTAVSAASSPSPDPVTNEAKAASPTLPAAPPRATPSLLPFTPLPPRRGALVEAGPGVTPPLLVKAAEPVYPVLARRLKRHARVLIRALVDENGKVVEAEVAEGDPSRLGFDEAALSAAYRMLYKPALKGGVPVKMWIELPVTFRP